MKDALLEPLINTSDYLTFTAVEDTEISFDLKGYQDSNLVLHNPISLQYKKSDETSFKDYVWDGSKTQVNSAAIGDKILLYKGEKIYFKGSNHTCADLILNDESLNFICLNFKSTKKVKASGNIMSIMDNKTTVPISCFKCLFSGCTTLLTSPELPATILNDCCYSYMFEGCTSLTEAPSLPATILAAGCYEGMFENCTSLVTAPFLPAIELDWRCYLSMFEGCTSLTETPILPSTTLVYWCYEKMFKNCTSLKRITCLATDINAKDCTYHWNENVSSSGTFNCKAGQTKWTNGVSGIPTGWKVEYV